MSSWTFLTNHAHVLFCLERDPAVRMRDVAERVGITERAAQRILADLVEGGYVCRDRDGRRNVYTINRGSPLRHAIEQHRTIGDLLHLLDPSQPEPPLPNEAPEQPEVVKRSVLTPAGH